MIEHTTLANKFLLNSSNHASTFIAWLNAILSAYNWEFDSEIIAPSGSTPENIYGKYYFTADSYIKIHMGVDNNYYTVIDIVTPNVATQKSTVHAPYFTVSVGKTSKGICLCVYSGESNDTRAPHFYNLYVGEIKTLDGQTTKGCIYVADDNSYTVATDSGISNEAKFASTIDNTKKTCLIPVTDSTTGAVFKNIFMLKNAPLNYNSLKLEDTQKIYLCGKAICLED